MRYRPISPALALAMGAAAFAASVASRAEGNARWPREIALEQATLIVYQPQIEKLEGVTMSGRTAVSWEPKGGSPAFGVFWFEVRYLVDKDSREMHIEEFKVTPAGLNNDAAARNRGGGGGRRR
jgi:hypothetical protein